MGKLGILLDELKARVETLEAKVAALEKTKKKSASGGSK